MIIYAIVVTYNGAKWIDKCFGSLINSSVPLNILAIDNASIDGTPQIIKEKYPQVEIIETGENLGFGKANNIGLKRVLAENADYAFLLNQDAWIELDTIEKLVSISINNPDFGIISPIHVNYNSSKIESSFIDYLSQTITPDFISDLYLNKFKELYNTKFANAAAWLITLKCIKNIGGFNPFFFHYGEDDDYLNRLIYHGLKIGIAAKIIIHHDSNQKNSQPNGLYLTNKLENNIKLQLMKLENEIPNIGFVLRKLISSYLSLYLIFFGNNHSISIDIKKLHISLKLRSQAKTYRREAKNNNTPFLNK